jgi:glutamate 5-kinase
MCIAPGQPKHPLKRVEAGARCTWFMPHATPVAARKLWISGSLKPSGHLLIDAGAVGALQRGRSLLPAGVTGASGGFERGDAVKVVGPEGQIVAHGLSAYSSVDVLRIMGRRSSEIEQLVGFRGRDEIIHRDDLVLSKP